MKSLSTILSAACVALGLALSGLSAAAQQPQPSPAAIAAAKEILAMKNANQMYANAIPNIVARAKDELIQTNLNYQKDLGEVAVVIAQKLAGREQEIGEGMAKVYAGAFTEQELKDLVTFYKSPLGQKLLSTEPKAIQGSMAFMNQWAQSFSAMVTGEFHEEMKKRGKPIT